MLGRLWKPPEPEILGEAAAAAVLGRDAVPVVAAAPLLYMAMFLFDISSSAKERLLPDDARLLSEVVLLECKAAYVGMAG